MTEIIRLQPHDPLPEATPNAVLLRRFGEDDPKAVVTELDFSGPHAAVLIAVGPGGAPLKWEDAIQEARREAEARGYDTLHVVDRTAGAREQDVLAHGGDHSVHGEGLADTDPEDGEEGSTILDRPHDAGFMR
jgi:hypothetical protein